MYDTLPVCTIRYTTARWSPSARLVSAVHQDSSALRLGRSPRRLGIDLIDCLYVRYDTPRPVGRYLIDYLYARYDTPRPVGCYLIDCLYVRYDTPRPVGRQVQDSSRPFTKTRVHCVSAIHQDVSASHDRLPVCTIHHGPLIAKCKTRLLGTVASQPLFGPLIANHNGSIGNHDKQINPPTTTRNAIEWTKIPPARPLATWQGGRKKLRCHSRNGECFRYRVRSWAPST